MAALLAAVCCGLIGTLVVANRMVFLAGGAAHAAYGGVGLAYFLALPVLPVTVGFTVAAALAMAAITLRRIEDTDTVIGVLWAAGMAFGIILLDLTPGYKPDLMSYLFGSIITVPTADLYALAGLDVGAAGRHPALLQRVSWPWPLTGNLRPCAACRWGCSTAC